MCVQAIKSENLVSAEEEKGKKVQRALHRTIRKLSSIATIRDKVCVERFVV